MNILLTLHGIVLDSLKRRKKKKKKKERKMKQKSIKKISRKQFNKIILQFLFVKRERNRMKKKRIKYEYHKQFKYLFLWNDACKIDRTASNLCAIIILEQTSYFNLYLSQIWCFYLSSLSHRRIHKCLSFFSLFFSFTFCRRQKVCSTFSFQSSFVLSQSSKW